MSTTRPVSSLFLIWNTAIIFPYSVTTLEPPFRHPVHVYPNQWLPIQSRDHSVWQIQHHWKLHCGRVHTMCMQPPAHIKHVLLYGLNCHSAKQLTYYVLVSIRKCKISTKKKKKIKQQATFTWDILL